MEKPSSAEYARYGTTVSGCSMFVTEKTNEKVKINHTAPFTVFGLNVAIGDNKANNIGKLWPQTPVNPDLDDSFKTKKFPCPNCACAYSQKYTLNRHLTYECGQEPRFKCPHCDYRCKKSANVYGHVRRRHKNCQVYAIDILKFATRMEDSV
ncbi:Longitudinals lacking protein, isoforms A/B/D/L [Anthophora plagiata]